MDVTVSRMHYVFGDLNENCPNRLKNLNVWFPVAKLFGKAWEVWPCWRRYITGGLKSPCQTQCLSFYLPAAMHQDAKLSATT